MNGIHNAMKIHSTLLPYFQSKGFVKGAGTLAHLDPSSILLPAPLLNGDIDPTW